MYNNFLLCLSNNFKYLIMILNIKEAREFNKWMQKIKNIHYNNNEKMLVAYSKVEALKYNPVN